MTNTATTTYSSLLANVESKCFGDETWGMVYLDNARAEGQSVAQFRACLAVLAKQGLYKVVDGSTFGAVKMP
jgi:hypothetical protein